MVTPLRALLIEDEPRDVELCLRELRREGFDPVYTVCQGGSELEHRLRAETWDIVLSDYTLPVLNALDALELVRRHDQEVPFIVVTGTLNEETAVDCLKRGADNYVLKENLARLGPAVRQALKFRDEHRRREQLEEQLRETQKMDALGQLAAGIAHDFNNLIAAIRGFAELAERTPQGTGDLARSLEGIQEACSSAAGLTKALLTFSRRGEARRAPLHLGMFVHDTLQFVRHMLPAAIEVLVEASATEPLFIRADLNQLQQVLINLVLNARDAMPQGGKLRITAAATTPPRKPPSDVERPAALEWVALGVEDSGEGIPEHVLAHVFEPFFTTKARGRGTGLGLSIVHGIVTEHGGAIEVDAHPGRGSRFLIKFPRAQAATMSPLHGTGRSEEVAHPTTLLLVEPHRQARAIMAECLVNAGHRVLQTETAAEALKTFRSVKDRLDLVILTLDQPLVGGLDCLRSMRCERPDLRAVLINNRESEATPPEELEGLWRLAKPFSMHELLTAVRRCTLVWATPEQLQSEPDPNSCRG